MKNKIHLLSKAQIGLDALPTSDRKKAAIIIEYLKDFPSNTFIKAQKIRDVSNSYIVQVNQVYSIIFQYQNNEVIISDILSKDRLDRLPVFFKQEV